LKQKLGRYGQFTLANLSGLPDTLVSHVSGLGHLVGVEHQADIVSSRDCQVREERCQ